MTAVSGLAAGEKPRVRETAESAAFSWSQTATSLELRNDGKIVWKLVADPKEPKSFFHPLATLDGEVLTEFEPKDHRWHRGLWWSWKYINGLNYWEEDSKTRNSEGLTELTSATFQPGDDFSARAELAISYRPPGQASVMTELRKLSITRPDDEGCYRIDWTSEFTAGNAPVTLGRTPPPGEEGGKSYGGYAGLSARLVNKPDGWSVHTSHGPRTARDAFGPSARWVDFSSPAGGIVIFDHPGNIRHPSPWYVFDSPPMSYFSPAILFNEPMVLAAGQSLELNYRVLIHSKPMPLEQIETDYRSFANPTKP